MKLGKYLPLLAAAAVVAMSGAHIAVAADLGQPAPALKAPPPLPPPFSWTGFYLGGNIGGAWAQHNWTDSLYGLSWNTGSNGVFIGGGQAGFNYQVGSFVFGIEGDFDWAASNNNNNNGIVVANVGNGDLFTVSSKNNWITTVAARLGYAWDRWLFYGKGGGGWVGNNGFTVTDITTGVSWSGSNSNTRSGWLAGVGFEWAITNNWTVKAEYDYIGLSSRTFIVPTGAPWLVGDTFTGSRNVQEFKLGFNYLFHWGAPLTAPY